MKIAVISDIHANLIALEKALEDIKSQNCDKIFCLGDLALAGAQPNETIEFVKKGSNPDLEVMGIIINKFNIIN